MGSCGSCGCAKGFNHKLHAVGRKGLGRGRRATSFLLKEEYSGCKRDSTEGSGHRQMWGDGWELMGAPGEKHRCWAWGGEGGREVDRLQVDWEGRTHSAGCGGGESCKGHFADGGSVSRREYSRGAGRRKGSRGLFGSPEVAEPMGAPREAGREAAGGEHPGAQTAGQGRPPRAAGGAALPRNRLTGDNRQTQMLS